MRYPIEPGRFRVYWSATRRILFQLNRNSHVHAASAARNDFGEWLDIVCQAVLPKQLLWLAENLCKANADFAWVEREIEKSLPDVQTEILSCAGSVSTGRPGEIANWLIDWPDVIGSDAIFSAVSCGGLDPARKAKVRSVIGNYVEEAFLKARKSATDHARILIAIEKNRTQREREKDRLHANERATFLNLDRRATPADERSPRPPASHS